MLKADSHWESFVRVTKVEPFRPKMDGSTLIKYI